MQIFVLNIKGMSLFFCKVLYMMIMGRRVGG